jgi:hypothetical protein
LAAYLPKRALKWIVVDYYGMGTIELWRSV